MKRTLGCAVLIWMTACCPRVQHQQTLMMTTLPLSSLCCGACGGYQQQIGLHMGAARGGRWKGKERRECE